MRQRFDRSLVAPTLVLVLIGVIGLRSAAAAVTTYTIVAGGPSVTVSIAAAGDDAAVTFGGAAGQRVSLRLSGVTIGPSACCSTKVSILKPDSTTLVAPTNVGTTGAFLEPVVLPTSGAYTIFVDPQASATGSVTLTLYDVPPDVTAGIAAGGPAVAVSTTTPGQNARVTFNGTAAQRVSLKIAPVCCTTKISILRPDGTMLGAAVQVGTSGGFVEPPNLPTTGTYTIVADPQSFATGSITLTLYDVPADPTATIVPGGPPVTVTTTTPGQNAKLTFSGTAGQRVSLKVGPTCCSTRVSILKPDGTALFTPMTFGTSGGFVDVKTLVTTGVHTITIDPQSFATGSVTLTLYNVPADVGGTIVPGGPPVTVTMTAPGQNATLSFEGTAGNRVSLNLNAVTISSTRVSILNPGGTTLVAPTTLTTAGGFIDAKTLPTTGTYSIVVDPQTTSTGSMTLKLYDVPADTSASAVPDGPGVTVTTTTPGQNARVTFDGAVDQRVSVQLSAVTIGTSPSSSAKVSLLKPDGTALVAPINFGTSGGFIDARTLPVAGTYTIVVDPQSTATGSATVTVNDVTDSPQTIVPGGPPVTVATATAGENVRLTFDGTATGRVSLAVTGVTITNSTVSILRPDGTTLASAANIGTSGTFLDATTLPVTGTYTVLVDPQGTAIGQMTLRLYDLPPDATDSILAGGAAVSVATTTPGQNGRLTFTGAVDQRVFLKMTNVTVAGSTCCSARVSFLKPDGTAVAAPTNVGTNGGFVDTLKLPVAGTYTILVDPQGTAVGGMTLRLYDVPADVVASATPGGAPVTVTTTVPGQNAKVSFDGVAGRQVSLNVEWTPNLCCLIKVSILRPDGGTILAPLSVGATGAFIDAKPLPVTGTYTLLVDPQDWATGTSRLTLYDVPPDVTAPITPGGPAVTLTTTANGQNARFTFTASAGDGALVTVGPNCCATSVSILKPDGTPVAPATPFAAAGGTLSARLPVAGNYTIFVDLQGTATGSVTVRLLLDSSAPAPPVLTITEASPDSHGNGAAFYYRPGGVGASFTVDAVTSDTGTGIQRVAFPGLSNGFSPTITMSDSTSPYSQSYTWASTATLNSTLNTVTVFDNVGNTSSSRFSVLPDSIAPTTTDDSASIGSGWKNTSQTVSLAPTDAGSGVAATYFTTDGSTPTTGSPQGTLVTLSAEGVYTVKYFSVDNVSNAEGVRTAGTQIRIDKTAPTSVITFPAAASSYNAGRWNSGCASAGFCGTASDALSGVQQVEFSLRQGSGNYWDGTAFASPSEVFLPASGTGAWSSAFGAASFPADGGYTMRVRSVDNATNVEAPVSRTFTYDTAAPDTAITAAPANPTNSTAPSFSFTSTEAGSTFQCSLDGAAFAMCTSPRGYTGLAAGPHIFQVRATDPAGNSDASPATHSWTIDVTAPDTSITSNPPATTSQTSATFTFTATEAGSTFQCSLDGAAFATCTSPRTLTGLAAGSHTFRVRATDLAGNVDGTPATYTWTIDLTPPQTTIVTAPAASTNSTSATFIFNSSEAGSTFECALDGAAFSPCVNPQTYTGLAEGSHTFQVRATDPSGNTDATPASHTWTLDVTAPDTMITAAPPSLSNSASATFSFSSNEPGTFQCSLDSGAFTACTTPRTYSGLADGAHNLRVFATDTAGNIDTTPASHNWTVDATTPDTTITATPPAATSQTSATFAFSASEAGVSFECSLDGSAFVVCTSPQSYSGLSEAAHTFRVRARDAAGNTDASPASFTWTVDLTAPDTTIVSKPANPTNQTGATFTFSSSQTGSSFECSLDGAAFAGCTSPKSYSGLAEGSHTFSVRATDPAGNADGSPASFGWTVDLTPPDTTITSGPPTVTNQTSATFAFTASEAGSTFQCSLDGAAFATCTSPKTYTGLAAGSRTVRVRATDPAGNVDPSEASYAWTVDTAAPQTTIVTAPAATTNQTSASFTFSASEAGSSFACSLDGSSFTGCTSPRDYTGLAEGSHTFRVQATDPAGNTDATPASFSWTIDVTPPDTTVVSGPANPSNQTTATFTFTSSQAGSSFECSLDGAVFAGCTSPKSYGGLAEGSHTFRVRAIDPAGNTDPSEATFTWTVDVTAPQTTILTAAAASTNSTSASFTFSSSDAGSSFACSLDGAPFAGCTSPKSYSGLAAGSHTFEVRATDAAGNTDASPASSTWTVDVTPPDTTMVSGPANPSNQASATFTFSASEAGSTFECSIDGATFAGCSSPKSYSGLADGSHTFEVRATDAAGNTDGSPASFGWTVDLTAPDTTIASGPPSLTNQTSATFAFTASEAGGTFQCSLDGAAFAACTSPSTSSGLADGSHTFRVRALDPAGNTDPSAAAFTWTVDATAPQTTILTAPAASTNATGASFTFSSSEAGSSFECSLDGGAFGGCTSPQAYGGLAEGAHTFEVRATDAAGNTDASAASFSWTVDLTAPDTAILSGPADPTAETTASFSFSASEPASFECSLDGAPFAACTSAQDYAGLASGGHLFEVRATDQAGNADATQATYSWTVL